MRRSLMLLLFAVHALPGQEEAERRLKLSKDTVLAGVSCMATGGARAVLHDDGRLDECPLANDTSIAGHVFPRGTWVRFDREATLASVWLPRNTRLGPVTCKGTGYKGWAVDFHTNGQLKACFSANDVVVDGVPCLGGSFLREVRGSTQLAWDSKGRLLTCRLSRDADVDGVRHTKGERIRRAPRTQ